MRVKMNKILVTGGAGYWVESGDMTQFRQKLGSCPPIPGYLPIAFDNLVYGQ